LAVIVVGGIGTIYGSVLGALFVGALPTLIREFVPDNWNLPILGWPIVTSDASATGFSKGALATIIYALPIIVVLVFEPRGLAGMWRRIQACFRTWPFSYWPATKGVTMRGKKLGRLVGVVAAVALAVGATGPAAFAGGAHSGKTPPNVPGFNGSTIKLGVITPQSGIASVVGKPLTEGNPVYWEARNAKGGGAGKYKVDLSVEDSQYDVATALQGYDSIKGDVAAFQQILGTQIVKSVNQRLKADNLYGGPASLEGVWVKQPSLMPFGTPYQVLAANGLDWYQKNGGQGKKVCAMAQDDAYGASGLDGLTQAAKTLNVK